MSIRVLELSKNSELVELSIDEQMRIGGGLTEQFAKEYYSAGLSGYVDGIVDISRSSSDPNVTIFTARPGAISKDPEDPNAILAYFGSISFNVQGNNPVYVGSTKPDGSSYNI